MVLHEQREILEGYRMSIDPPKIRVSPGNIVRVRIGTNIVTQGVEWTSGVYFGTVSGLTLERSEVIEKLDLRLIVTKDFKDQNGAKTESKEVKLLLV